MLGAEASQEWGGGTLPSVEPANINQTYMEKKETETPEFLYGLAY